MAQKEEMVTHERGLPTGNRLKWPGHSYNTHLLVDDAKTGVAPLWEMTCKGEQRQQPSTSSVYPHLHLM